jgi:hypothetical protein
MNIRVLFAPAAAAGLMALFLVGNSSQSQEALKQPQGIQPGVQVEARGPVHEAFAMPLVTQPEQGPVITKQPPAPIEELPPDQKPEGDNVQWIPGYWAWDADTNDFVWVSGCWRDVPPGRTWIPGHWQEIDQGWVWVSGLWTAANTEEVQYLPPPPPTVDEGPSAPAPDVTSIYAPGCWVYREGRYMWRPGHWVPFRPGWVWVPARYVWTPSGCLFVDDYWDYPLDERGLLFAPCSFDLRVWGRQPFVPQYAIQPDFLLGALFVNAANHHYFFGDYFDERYRQRFVPWTDFHPHGRMEDPNFSYYRHLHAGNAGWENGIRELYRGRLSGAIPRPPRTLNQQIETVHNFITNKTGNINVEKNINLTRLQNATALATLKDIHNTHLTHLGSLGVGKESNVTHPVLKMQSVLKDEHLREQKQATLMREAATNRRENEAKMLLKGGIPYQHTDRPNTVKMAVPHPLPHVVPPRVTVRTPPPRVTLPAHVAHAIPRYEPPHPPGPPRHEKKA